MQDAQRLVGALGRAMAPKGHGLGMPCTSKAWPSLHAVLIRTNDVVNVANMAGRCSEHGRKTRMGAWRTRSGAWPKADGREVRVVPLTSLPMWLVAKTQRGGKGSRQAVAFV